MNQVENSPAVLIASAEDVVSMEEAREAELLELEGEINEESIKSSLAGHIQTVFQENKDARSTSGIEDKLLESLRAYNGHYDPEDAARIKESGGSDIYMNITATKCRAAMSWIRDILLPAKENAWALSPTPIPELPDEMKQMIEERFKQEMAPPEQPPQEAQQGQQGNKAIQAAAQIKNENEMKLDLEDALLNEIYSLAERELKKYELETPDRDWETA